MVYTVKQVSDRLQIAIPTVRELIKSGVIPGIQVGVTYRVESEDLEKFIETNKTKRVVACE